MSNTAIVTIDGISIESVSPCVRVLDVVELQPSRTTNAQERLGAPGSVITRDHINSRQVRVQFALLTSDYAQRTAALSDIAAWATQGQWLQISDRPGQRLQVICTDTPLSMSKRKWTDLCEMTFTAFNVPFWEDVLPVSVGVNGAASATLTLRPSGNVRQVPLRCAVTPKSGTLSTLTIAANGAKMSFSGLAVPAGKTLSIDYVEGCLTARWTRDDGAVVPCLRYRTGAETIPLNARQNNTVTITANTAANITASAKGWYW